MFVSHLPNGNTFPCSIIHYYPSDWDYIHPRYDTSNTLLSYRVHSQGVLLPKTYCSIRICEERHIILRLSLLHFAYVVSLVVWAVSCCFLFERMLFMNKYLWRMYVVWWNKVISVICWCNTKNCGKTCPCNYL